MPDSIGGPLPVPQARRRMMILTADGDSSAAGARLWRSFLRRLEEMESLFGSLSNHFEPFPRVLPLLSV